MNASARLRFSRALAAIDEIIVSSHDLLDFFRNKFTGPIRYISPLMPLPAHWDSKPDTADRKNAIVTSIGAFIPSYGFQHVAEAVQSLRERGHDVELVLLDGAFAGDDAYKDSVVRDRPWIRDYESVPHSEVGGFLRASDVFVRAFAHESYGLSRVEAILSGVPVIATNIGETRGMLTYEFGDIDRLVEHLEAVLDHRSEHDLARWQDVYRTEAHENLQQYLSLITGETNA
jgi:glycosyltransferase involved in cell wall biosynthesis